MSSSSSSTSTAATPPRAITARLSRCRDLPALVEAFHAHHGELNPIHLSTFWMSVARLSPPAAVLHGDELRPARELTLQQLPLFEAWSVANTAYALGKLGVGDRPPWNEAWEIVERLATARCADLTEQGLSNIVWAFAKSERPAPALFDAVAAEAVQPRRRAKFLPQNISNLCWGFA